MLLSERALSELTDELDASGGGEVCGVLLGSVERDHIHVVRTLHLHNAASLPSAFSIPSYEMRRARATARDLCLALVALYHTHPAGTVELSASDRVGLNHSRLPWAIVTRVGTVPLVHAYDWPTAVAMRVEWSHKR